MCFHVEAVVAANSKLRFDDTNGTVLQGLMNRNDEARLQIFVLLLQVYPINDAITQAKIPKYSADQSWT